MSGRHRPLYDFRAKPGPDPRLLRNLRPIEPRPYDWLVEEFTDVALALVVRQCAESPNPAVRQAGLALRAHFDRYPLPSAARK